MMAGWHRVFEGIARDNNKNDVNFVNNFDTFGFRNYVEESVTNYFLINFGMILLIFLFILIVYGIIKILTWRQQANYDYLDDYYKQNRDVNVIRKRPERSCMSKILSCFEFKILLTMILMFTVELTVYTIYDIIKPKFDDVLFGCSFIIALIFFIIIVFLIIFDFMYPFANNNYLLESTNYSRFGFIFRGFKLQNILKNFQGI